MTRQSTGHPDRREAELAAAVTPLLSSRERILALGWALPVEHPIRTNVARSARTGFLFVVPIAPAPYVLTDARFLLLNPGFRIHPEIVFSTPRPVTVAVDKPRALGGRLVVLENRLWNHRIAMSFRGSSRRFPPTLLAALSPGSERVSATPPHGTAAPTSPSPAAPLSAARTARPWTADAHTIAENRQGRITPAQRARIRGEAVRAAAGLVAGGLGIVAMLALASLSGYIVFGGVWVVAALCFAGAPAVLVIALQETRPGALCGWAAGPVAVRLKTHGMLRARPTFTVVVGRSQLTHVGDVVGLEKGADYYAYFLPKSRRIIAMERVHGSATGATIASPSTASAVSG